MAADPLSLPFQGDELADLLCAALDGTDPVRVGLLLRLMSTRDEAAEDVDLNALREATRRPVFLM